MTSGGPRPGAGRKPGQKNKRTIELEDKARAMLEREAEMDRARAANIAAELSTSRTAGRKLAKEVLDDFMNIFAGMAAYYQPYAQWTTVVRDDGTTARVNANPNMSEPMFRTYATLAKETARDLAQFQSPKMSAVMVGAAMVTEIEVTGGLPAEDDLAIAPEPKAGDHVRTIELLANDGEPGILAGGPQGDGGAPDAPSVSGEGVPDSGQAQGAEVRKALG